MNESRMNASSWLNFFLRQFFETDRQTETPRHRQTDRGTEREEQRQIDTDRQTESAEIDLKWCQIKIYTSCNELDSEGHGYGRSLLDEKGSHFSLYVLASASTPRLGRF